jgi:hypothetical protein
VDARHLERLLTRQRRQDPGQATGQHGLPGAGRPSEQEVVASRRGDLQCPAAALLSADVGKVQVPRAAPAVRRRGNVRRRLALPAQVRGRLGEMAQRDRLDARERGFRSRFRCAEDPGQTRLASTLRCSERPAHRANAAVEGELANGGMTGETIGRDLPRRRQHGQCDRKIEAGSLLAQCGRCEVDREPGLRPLQLG